MGWEKANRGYWEGQRPVDRSMKIPGPVRLGLPASDTLPTALAFPGMPVGSLGSGVDTVRVRYHHRFLTAHLCCSSSDVLIFLFCRNGFSGCGFRLSFRLALLHQITTPNIYDVVFSPKHTQKFLPIHLILILSRAIASSLYQGLFFLLFGKNKGLQKYVWWSLKTPETYSMSNSAMNFKVQRNVSLMDIYISSE